MKLQSDHAHPPINFCRQDNATLMSLVALASGPARPRKASALDAAFERGLGRARTGKAGK